MTVTINVNGLSLVHRGSGGVSRATLPDVCLTPPNAAPIPYPNVAFATTLVNGTLTVTADGGHSIAVQGSAFATSTGGAAGMGGGVMSGTTGAAASFLSHSLDVRFEGRGPARLTDKMLHNAGNTIDCGGVMQNPVATGRAPSSHGTKMRAGTHQLRVVVTSADEAITNASVRIEGPGRSKASKVKNTFRGNTVTFARIPRGSYRITVAHACHVGASVRSGASPHGSADSITVALTAPFLRDVAHSKNIRLFARPDTPDLSPIGSPPMSMLSREFDGGIVGFFWASRQPNAAWPTPFQNGDNADVIAFVDQLSGAGVDLMGTPLVWTTGVKSAARTVRLPNGHLKKIPAAVGNTPAWANALTPAEIGPCIDRFITSCITAFKTKIHSWVVVNESVNLLLEQSIREHPVWKAYGLWDPAFDPRHPNRFPACWSRIEHAFRVAHAADPTALLILNDFDNECWDGHRRPSGPHDLRHLRSQYGGHDRATDVGHTLRMIRAEQFHYLANHLRARLPTGPGAVPLANFAVGFQMHWPSNAYSVKLLRDNVRRYRAMGLQIVVTELDVTMASGEPDAYSLYKEALRGFKRTHAPAADFLTFDQIFMQHHRNAFVALYDNQAALYRQIFEALLSEGNVPIVATWGIDDAPTQFVPYGYWFDSAGIGCTTPYGGYARKPAYFSICEAIAQAPAHTDVRP